jgi:hypothetical protein
MPRVMEAAQPAPVASVDRLIHMTIALVEFSNGPVTY